MADLKIGKGLRHFSQEDHQMADKHVFSIIRFSEMHVENHSETRLFQMVVIPKLKNKKFWGRCGDTGVLVCCW
jgi:hypothetical protein